MKTWLPQFAKSPTYALSVITVSSALMFGGSTPSRSGEASGQTTNIPILSSDPWKANNLIKPDELAESLSAPANAKPSVFCVTFPALYQRDHIAGSKFVGPGSKPDGIQALKRAVANLPHHHEIVIYCGCCPWVDCPNIRPAFLALKDLGFTNIKVLYLPNKFQQDWIAAGFPAEKGGVK